MTSAARAGDGDVPGPRAPARTMRALLIALPLALVAACAADGESGPSDPFGPVTLRAAPEAGPAEPETGVPDDEVDAVAERMRELVRRGDYEGALRASDELLARKPTSEQRSRVERMRVEARRRLLQTLYLDGIIRLDRDAFAIGDPITGEVVLANLSAGPLEILDRPRAGGATATPSVLRFEVGYVEYAPNGAVVRDLITWNVEVGRDVILAPGERFSFPLRLATDEHNPGGATLRTYDIEASLYPAEIRAGDEAIPGIVRFEKRVARVFPRNFEHLRRDPAGRIAEAIAKRSPPHLPLAAALVPPADRGRALAEILRALETTGESAPDQATLVACCVAARILTGRDLPAEPALWLEELRGSPPK